MPQHIGQNNVLGTKTTTQMNRINNETNDGEEIKNHQASDVTWAIAMPHAYVCSADCQVYTDADSDVLSLSRCRCRYAHQYFHRVIASICML